MDAATNVRANGNAFKLSVTNVSLYPQTSAALSVNKKEELLSALC